MIFMSILDPVRVFTFLMGHISGSRASVVDFTCRKSHAESLEFQFKDLGTRINVTLGRSVIDCLF